MSDFINEFRDEMTRLGCGPASNVVIKPNNKWNNFTLQGDAESKQAGGYILAIEDDFAYGAFINHREGVVHPFNSKSAKKSSPEEKEEWRLRRDAQKTAMEAESKAKNLRVSREAKLLWDKSPIANADHPYLVRKGIDNAFLRQDGDNLLVPLYSEGKLWSIQTIYPDGDKRFLPGGRKKGCYCALFSKDDSWLRVVVCEGLATGKSIRAALPEVPVVIALDGGNLMPVIREMRKRYPEAQIIIAGDNDRWGTKPDGTPYNAGMEFAEKVVADVENVHLVWPEFPENHPEKLKDFNDLAQEQGIDAVRERIVGSPSVPALVAKAEISPLDIHWKSQAIWKDEKKEELKDVSYNYGLILSEHPAMDGVFAWDEFHLCVMMVKCPIWSHPDKFDVHRLSDQDTREADYWLQKLGHNLSGSIEKTRGAIDFAASKNKIHPARDYFDALAWDGTPRLDSWLIKYCSAKKDDPDYVRAVGRTWMIAAVKRVYEPGCKFDHMLILEGDQGAGKSTVLKELATFGRGENAREYFSDQFKIKNCTDKDELAKLSGCIIIELAEMSGFNKADRDELTSFVTTVKDSFRPPYGRELQVCPRQFVLSGTYNPINGIFTDPTGYRRFWPVAVKRIDLAGLRQDKEQIWAEAVTRYKQGESLVLSPELYKKAEIAGADRRVIDIWTSDVLNSVRGKRHFEIRDVLSSLGIMTSKRTMADSRRIANILRAEGFKQGRKKIAGRSTWVWIPEGGLFEDEYFIDYEHQVSDEVDIDF